MEIAEELRDFLGISLGKKPIFVSLGEEAGGKQKLTVSSAKILSEKKFIGRVKEFFSREGFEIEPIRNYDSGLTVSSKAKNQHFIVTITVSGGGLANPTPPFWSFITINKWPI